jgi:hypothetical protein
MTHQKHLKHHIKLHNSLYELVDDYISQHDTDIDEMKLMELIDWSYQQCKNPDEQWFDKSKQS